MLAVSGWNSVWALTAIVLCEWRLIIKGDCATLSVDVSRSERKDLRCEVVVACRFKREKNKRHCSGWKAGTLRGQGDVIPPPPLRKNLVFQSTAHTLNMSGFCFDSFLTLTHLECFHPAVHVKNLGAPYEVLLSFTVSCSLWGEWVNVVRTRRLGAYQC